MSWNVAAIGTHKEVLDKMGADRHIDPSAAVAVKKALCAFNDKTAVKVKTHGHVGDNGAGNLMIQIDTV